MRSGICSISEIVTKTAFSAPTQNFTEIAQSAADLWPKNDFQFGGPPS